MKIFLEKYKDNYSRIQYSKVKGELVVNKSRVKKLETE